jgi:hypothetical protein
MGRQLIGHPGRSEANQTCGKLSFLRCTQNILHRKIGLGIGAASRALVLAE